MSNDFLPAKDKLIVQWATACASYAAPRPLQTGLATTVVTELTTRRNDFQNSILLVESTHAAYRAAVKTKNTQKKRVEETARLVNQQVQGNPAVNDETKLGLGLTVKEKREHKLPQVPTDLRVKGTENGVNLLKWSSNKNSRATMYEIWAKYPNSMAWQYIESVVAISFRHTNVQIGAKIQYRVRAKVNGSFSVWSNEASISDGVSSPTLIMDKAA